MSDEQWNQAVRASQQQLAFYSAAGLVSPQAAALQLYAAQLQAKGTLFTCFVVLDESVPSPLCDKIYRLWRERIYTLSYSSGSESLTCSLT